MQNTTMTKAQKSILATLTEAGGAFVFTNVNDERHAKPFRNLKGKIHWSWSGCTMCAWLVDSTHKVERRHDGTRMTMIAGEPFEFPCGNTIYVRVPV